MKIEIRKVNVTKSILNQMDKIELNSSILPKLEVLGWVVIDFVKRTLVKKDQEYFLAPFITNIETERVKAFSIYGNDSLFTLTSINTHGGDFYGLSVFEDESENVKTNELIFEFKKRSEQLGQIYY